MLTHQKRQQKIDCPYFLKIVKPTILKKETIQSSQLPLKHKVFIDKIPQEFPVLAYHHENQHYKVTLADQTIKGFNTWYVYDGHAELVDRAGKSLKKAGTGSLAERVVACCEERGYSLDRGQGEVNLIGIEGMNLDGTPNNDAPNVFNDLIGCLVFENERPKFKGLYVGTTEPGRYYTVNKLNAKGAARLEFGQQRCWRTGLHNGKYEALVQTGDRVKVWRDGNQDYSRTGDTRDTGFFGINIHHGGSNPINNIGRYSAGCQVIRSTKDFAEFMQIVKSDLRWRTNLKHIFKYTLLWNQWL
ncbi:hypothetical protein [Pleurocapsa sp. PCC 7319]|uniref:hypothetical protein n=1 Tax=Pleurocapsa sp. PCC 7319 TaxID=118161 RepID=UPI0003473881|nr:hypothetical protein [Pleurocapsa sp. PCC 7319]